MRKETQKGGVYPWLARGRKPQAHSAESAGGEPGQTSAQRPRAYPAEGRIKVPIVAPARGQKRNGSAWRPRWRRWGVLTMADLTAFAGYWSGRMPAGRKPRSSSPSTAASSRRPPGTCSRCRRVSIAQQNLKIMQSFCSDFGLTPATRARIIAGGSGTEDVSEDPMEKLLKGGWQDD